MVVETTDNNKAIKFGVHPSLELIALFKNRPFQGQAPEKAEIIFLSSDANYSPEVSNHTFFKCIMEYQKDGVTFWGKHKCHHPFLLANYPFSKTKAGVPFHRNFSKIGLGSEFSSHISFLELLDVPTIGNKSENINQFYSLVSESHLRYVDELMLGGGNKLFFVSKGVLKDMAKLKRIYSVFKWLDFKAGSKEQFSTIINGGNKIQEIYHFSSSEIHGQLDEINLSIRSLKLC